MNDRDSERLVKNFAKDTLGLDESQYDLKLESKTKMILTKEQAEKMMKKIMSEQNTDEAINLIVIEN